MSERKSTQEAAHAVGAAVGRPPWGYVATGQRGRKVFEPTAEGRIWIPRIFQWVADGHSCAWVARQLERYGIKSNAPSGRWHEPTIVKMIHRTTYSGARERKERDPLEVEALVSPELQEQAIAMMAANARGGPRGSSETKSLLTKLRCGHPDCPGNGDWPMYRIKSRHGYWYYRCAGKVPQRRGCGAPMIRTDALDALVLSFARWSVAEGRRIRSLDPEAQREALARKDIRAWKDAGDDGAVRVWIDGLTTADRSVIGTE